MLFFLIALLTLLQSATYLIVRQANRQHALAAIETSLRNGAKIFERLIKQRNVQISTTAAILSRDHAFQIAFAGADEDRATTLSALENLRGRIKADVVLIASMENKLIFDTRRPDLPSGPFPFPKMIRKAEKTETAYNFVILDGDLFAMAITPLLAPDPIAWLCPGFRIDDGFAREIQGDSNLEITFLNGQDLFATSFGEKKRIALVSTPSTVSLVPNKIVDLNLDGEHFLSYSVPLATENGNASALLQRSLDKELAPYLRLERTFLVFALVGLFVSVGVGIWIARNISKPVLQLTEGARRIGEGDYAHRVRVPRGDELGILGDAFNRMSEGLAERDQVRDLLGKVVSPAVAAELLRKDVTLGGEEREVTILFSDLRSFTSISEARSPQRMLAILNGYFTVMCGIIEKHGGVVDKYMGDAIMALFGAPLAHTDDADRALQAALDMSDALDELNRQWQAKGRRGLKVGIGINTDVVVAGNMGSQTRLNYTVIGDGVNLASRLEELTKTPEYETRIIVSHSTLSKATKRYQTRRLGEVAVKGKQNATEIYALLGREA